MTVEVNLPALFALIVGAVLVAQAPQGRFVKRPHAPHPRRLARPP